MGNKDWRERYVNLAANVQYELMAAKEINIVLIQNTDSSNTIYAGLESSTGSTVYETAIFPGQWGVIGRPFTFRKAFLFSGGNIDRVKVVELLAPDPLSLIKSLIATGASSISVAATVGLKASELNIESVTKNLFVKEVTSTSLATGQKTANTTAAALAGSTVCREVLIQNDSGSSNSVKVGNDTNQYIELSPGDAISLPIDNVSKVYVKTASGTATVNWLARG